MDVYKRYGGCRASSHVKSMCTKHLRVCVPEKFLIIISLWTIPYLDHNISVCEPDCKRNWFRLSQVHITSILGDLHVP